MLYNDSYTTTNIICNMVQSSNTDSSTPSSTSTHTTNVQIINSDAGWSNSIRQIFIYGTGAFRLSLLRSGGSPGHRAFVIASTVVSDVATKALNNVINDPSYVNSHITNWRKIWKGDSVELHVDNDADTMNKIKGLKNDIPDGLDGLNDFSDNLLNRFIGILKPVLEPVQVDYSNAMLADQIYGISILLFVLSVLITFLLLAFMFNILILVYSDKLMNLFTNKYIRWYIVFNKKIIGIELFFLGSSILYFMYMLSYGIHFIATHPITIN